jgi:GDP-L-fucose synthase
MESGYGHAKRHMLAMLEAYRYSANMEFVYLVSGNLYGPRDRFNTETGHVLPSLVKKFYDASRTPGWGPDLPTVDVWGDGSATRDFLYNGDLARIVRMAIETPINPAAINIGSGQQASIEYVCKRLSSISGLDYSRVHYDVNQPTGRPDCYADLSALHDLGFKPMWNLGEGLRATYDWYALNQAR